MAYKYHPVSIPDDWKKHPALMSIDPICLEILLQRGMSSVQDVVEFLFPQFSDVIKNTRFVDIDTAIDRLIEAINNQEKIVVYQDYDVDGCSACAIMVENLHRFGADVWYYGNDRHLDGYGLCVNGINNILKQEPDTKLVVTVDNGIVAHQGIEYAIGKGLDVIVTDHHEPGDSLPPALAIINPKRKDETYPFRDLCGAGIALKLMFGLAKRMRKNLNDVAMSTDLAALATVADVVPMVGENRAIVKEGLKYINEGIRPAFKILNAIKDNRKITGHRTIAYQYAPMINSISRMGYDTGIVVDTFLSEDENVLKANLLKMDEVNNQRKDETKREMEVAVAGVDKYKIGSSIVFYDDSFQEGIVGIVAGRLKTDYKRPVVVFAPGENNTLKASARSVSCFNLKDNLDKMSDILVGYGGHAMAAGLTIKKDDYDEFVRRFTEITDKEVDIGACEEAIQIDAVVKAENLTEDFIFNLSVLEPYGEGFKEPFLGLIADIDDVIYMGKEKQHVKWIDSTNNVSVIKWNGAEDSRRSSTLPQKFVGNPALNEFNGRVSVQFLACS